MGTLIICISSNNTEAPVSSAEIVLNTPGFIADEMGWYMMTSMTRRQKILYVLNMLGLAYMKMKLA